MPLPFDSVTDGDQEESLPMDSVGSAKPAVDQPALSYRQLMDVPAQRQAVFDRVRHAYADKKVEFQGYTMDFADVGYRNEKPYRTRDEKDALLGRRRLHWALQGRLRLLDAEGKVVKEDPKPRTLAQVPYLTNRGTFIHNGNDYVVANQQRLRPGIYTRRQDSGEVESQFNIIPGTGRGFRVKMDPETGVFRLQVGQSNMKLFPILKDMGFNDKQIKEAWGAELYGSNALADDKDERKTLPKLLAKLGARRDVELQGADVLPRLQEVFERMRLDPDVTRRTMGKAYERVDADTLLAATQRILKVNRGEEQPDERDDLPFQSFHSAEDFLAEHVEKDSHDLIRQAYWKLRNGREVPNNYFTKQLNAVLIESGLAAPTQEINPVEVLDARHKINRMGEGGIGSTQAVSRDARGVQPSHFGFIDPIRAPESAKIGLDMRVAQGVVRGSDGQLYSQVYNHQTKSNQYLSVADFADNPVAFPGEFERSAARTQLLHSKLPQLAEAGVRAKVRAMSGGKIQYLSPDAVAYELPSASNLFTAGTNFVPLASAIKGQRLLMGARMQSQALPLEEPEAPLVQSAGPDGSSMNRSFARDMGAVFGDRAAGGQVLAVEPDFVRVKYDDGRVEEHDLYNYLPLNAKTTLHNTPLVAPGQRIEPGQLLARSNFTDGKGDLALGRNARVGFHMMDGMTHEDAIVLSETAAKKFSSQQMYSAQIEKGDTVDTASKSKYVTKYPGIFTAEQLKKVDKTGVVQPGTVVNQGDPLILAVGNKKTRIKGSLMRSQKSEFTDASETWDHEQPGEVVDVYKTGKGWKVTVKTHTPTRVGDKLSNNYGGKGVIARVVPDSEMPTDQQGNPLEVVLNPVGVISRVNPSQIIESALGKVAMKTGQPYILPSFSQKHLAEFAMQELEKHGLSDTETLIDPRTGRQIPDVFTGVQHFFKLHHLAESKSSARSQAAYTMDDTPAKGGDEGAKRVGLMESFALLSHGATEVLKDAKLMRGQRNDDWWQLYRLGKNPPAPRISRQYKKFEAMLQGSGIALHKSGTKTQVLPMTDADARVLTEGRELDNGDTVDFDSGEPIAGGLFDIGKTGGADGTKWSQISLPEPMPNPIMEEPIKALLGLTGPKFESILSGAEPLNGAVGGNAIQQALGKLDIDKEILRAKHEIREGRRTKRDKAVKRLGYLTTLQKNQIDPKELMVSLTPVVPPKFRPVSRMEGVELVSDINQLYRELMETKTNYQMAVDSFGTPGDTRLDMYKALKAVTGLGNPLTVESQQRGVRGLLKQVLGDSPKFGHFQRNVLGQTVDNVGRSVIVPDPDYDIDEIGIPVDSAWTLFKPFVIRDLTRRGMSATQALQSVAGRGQPANDALLRVMKERPIIANRAPSLHKHNMTAHFARPVAGHALRLPIAILAGHGADFDGDALNYHVPVSDEAVKDAREKMLPSTALYSAKDFGVHMLPTQGYVLGLYQGTKGDSGGTPRIFNTTKEVLAAYRNGELKPTDNVQVRDR